MTTIDSSDVTKHIRSMQLSSLNATASTANQRLAPNKPESFLMALGKMLTNDQAQTSSTDSTDISTSTGTFDAAALFSDIDTNGDNSMAIMPPPPPQIDLTSQFSAIDTDSSGGISLSELETALLTSASTASTTSTTAGTDSTSAASTSTDSTSTNSSTAVSNAISQLFTKIDANGDGSITLDELTQYLKAYRHHHHHHRVTPSLQTDTTNTSSDTTTTTNNSTMAVAS